MLVLFVVLTTLWERGSALASLTRRPRLTTIRRRAIAGVEPTLRVAFQGEPGAYSEKACRELLGPNVPTVGKGVLIVTTQGNFKRCLRF